MSVRVTAKMLCDRCKSEGAWWVPEIIDGQSVGERLRECPDCLGAGTVAREVSCNGCRWWVSQHGYLGLCVNIERFMERFNTRSDHACKAWEPRE